jgi:hypothetical protein
MPGVLGPITRALFFVAYSVTLRQSKIGTCSGIATSNFIPLSIASMAAFRKKGAGINMAEIVALVFLTASAISS